jgi:hypothetical protein
MPPLLENHVEDFLAKQANVRVKTAGTKLSREEMSALEAHCKRLATNPGELIRQLILAELEKERSSSNVDPVLSEIIGVRLLLVNLLKPQVTGQAPLSPVGFESLLDQIKKVKREVALEIQREHKGDNRR